MLPSSKGTHPITIKSWYMSERIQHHGDLQIVVSNPSADRLILALCHPKMYKKWFLARAKVHDLALQNVSITKRNYGYNQGCYDQLVRMLDCLRAWLELNLHTNSIIQANRKFSFNFFDQKQPSRLVNDIYATQDCQEKSTRQTQPG